MPTLNKTATIERMLAVEQRVGLTFEGLYAASFDGGIGWLTVNFDVMADAGDLEDDVEVIVSAFNAAGQILGTTTEHLYANDFFGMDTKEALIQINEAPAQIRVYPKRA